MPPAGQKGALRAIGIIVIVLGIVLLLIYNGLKGSGISNQYEDLITFFGYAGIIMGVIILITSLFDNNPDNKGKF